MSDILFNEYVPHEVAETLVNDLGESADEQRYAALYHNNSQEKNELTIQDDGNSLQYQLEVHGGLQYVFEGEIPDDYDLDTLLSNQSSEPQDVCGNWPSEDGFLEKM